jgi:uncharacterized protein YcbK (DUF882 family)
MHVDQLRRRRVFLKRSIMLGLGAMGASSFANPLRQQSGLLLPQYYANEQDAAAFWAQPRTLNLYRKETGEHRVVCYWRDGQLDQNGYREACHLLRDVRANQTVAMDLRLLNLLRGQQGWLEAAYGFRAPYQINSGFRSAHTNATTEGAVKNSFHTKAMAADGKYVDLPIEYQGQLMAAFRSGGVGFYVDSRKFIHTDVGGVRFWVSK